MDQSNALVSKYILLRASISLSIFRKNFLSAGNFEITSVISLSFSKEKLVSTGSIIVSSLAYLNPFHSSCIIAVITALFSFRESSKFSFNLFL